MKLRSFIAALNAALLCVLLAASPAGAGSMLLLGEGQKAAAGGAYTGPGDIQASALAWYGLRGYSAAYSTGANPAIDIVDQANANTLTVNILSSGDLDLASIATWVAAHSVTSIFVKKIYDQSGNALHCSQATLANMSELKTGSITGLSASRPGLKMGASVFSQCVSAGSIASTSVPFNISAVAERTGSTTSFQGIIGAPNTAPTAEGIYFNGSANTVLVFSGSGGGLAPTAADNAFHAIQANYFADPNSTAYVDGTLFSPGASITPVTMNGLITIGTSTTTNTQFVVGFWQEGGFWAGDQTSHNSAMNSNQRTYWGF